MPSASFHSLTIRKNYRLPAALALSLILHALPMLAFLVFVPFSPSTARSLTAELRPPPAPPAAPPLTLPEQPEPPVARKHEHRPDSRRNAPAAASTWTDVVRHHLKKLEASGRFYPAEAIAQGLQGEVLVLLVLDGNGQVGAARIEQSSGYPILDDAALRAVRSLQSLPADAPRQALLPVRFRLR